MEQEEKGHPLHTGKLSGAAGRNPFHFEQFHRHRYPRFALELFRRFL
jgi:hypothetical protein